MLPGQPRLPLGHQRLIGRHRPIPGQQNVGERDENSDDEERVAGQMRAGELDRAHVTLGAAGLFEQNDPHAFILVLIRQ